MKKYIYSFKNNAVRKRYFGRICVIECEGRLNSVRIRFIDNDEKTITSANALKELIENKDQLALF